MRKNLPEQLPEIVFSSSDAAVSKAIGRAMKAGRLRKVASKIYTSNFKDPPEDIIARNRYHILGYLFPNAVLSARSAFEGGPTQDGQIFLTYKYTKKIQLPGLTVHLLKGHGPTEGDTAFMGSLYLASRPRAYLENMQISRKRDGNAKTLTPNEIEERLENLCRIHGIQELNTLRDQAKKLASELELTKELKKLGNLIGAILGTRDIKILKSKRTLARAMGEPYDQFRLELFANLATTLKTEEIPKRKNTATTKLALQNLAFFESYFSNYIEGTEFLIEEAAKIIFKHEIIPGRIEDTHDVLGTYSILSNPNAMKQVPQSPQKLIELLKTRHVSMMKERPNVAPGRFKEKKNQAGSTVFVAPELVTGTLKKGFEIYLTLDPGIERAMFMMFMIAEIHPFIDGNGRLARIMMNAELVTENEMRIIIPTVYREDYLLTLRRLSRSHDAAPYVRMLARAQEFSASIDFNDFDRALNILRASNAFLEPREGKLIIHH